MHRFAIASGLLHLVILAITMLGVFKWNRSEIHIMQPIPVEIVDAIDDTSKSPKPLKTSKEQAKQEDVLKQPLTPPAPEPKPEPKLEPAAKPEPIVEKLQPKTEPLPKPEITNKAKEEIASILPAPKPKPTPSKPAAKPKAPLKSKSKPQEADFSSVLKNLTKTRPASKSERGKETITDDGLGGELSSQIAASELDRVRKQIESVWRIPAGTKDIEKIQVTLKISMNPDRTVREARVVNQHLMVDVSYRIVAESALRAVNEFKYQPLELPINKYQVWKEITIMFDPKHVL